MYAEYWKPRQKSKVVLFGVSLSAAGGTGELNGANDGILGIDEFETLEVKFADLHALTKTKFVNVDLKAFGHCSIESLYFEALHCQAQFTTGLNTLGMTDELDRNLNNDRLGVVDLEEVDVEDVVLNGMELNIFQNSHSGLAVEVELDGEDVGSVDEFADSLVRNNDISGDKAFAITEFHDFLTFFECSGEGQVNKFATVDNSGDEVLGTQCLCGLLAKLGTGSG